MATVSDVAKVYIAATEEDCKTRALTASFDRQNRTDWRNYLVSYTLILSGCPPLFGPLDGGIGAFGPANTAAIGVERQPLGVEDAAALIDHYTRALGDALGLLSAERETVTTFLWQTAREPVVADASQTLSMCNDRIDAGD